MVKIKLILSKEHHMSTKIEIEERKEYVALPDDGNNYELIKE